MFLFLLGLSACQQRGDDPQDLPELADFSGIYVSDGYTQRAEGYDWVAVSVEALSDSTAHVAVRSRLDRKRATCTFDSDARWTGAGSLSISIEDKNFLLTLSGDSLNIRGADEKSSNLLYYFCSGGASLEGTYVRLNEPVDEAQLSAEGFTRELSLQGITFRIREANRGFETMVTIEPSGLENDNNPVSHRIYGWVSGAETEDLNSDGSPELMVYVRSTDGAVHTRVIGYSVNNGKSMSQVAVPDIRNNAEASRGYLGYDEFAVVETFLVQRFPVFNHSGAGYEPSGTTRQVQYRLQEGEAARQFVIDRIVEY